MWKLSIFVYANTVAFIILVIRMTVISFNTCVYVQYVHVFPASYRHDFFGLSKYEHMSQNTQKSTKVES